MNCLNKKRYPTKRMADDYAKAYNNDPFIKEEDFLTSYHCLYHDGWHVGHTEQRTLPPHIRVQKLLDKIKKDKNDTN